MMRLPPYAEVLGIQPERDEQGHWRLLLPYGDHLVARPGFLHGGAIAGLLELAAFFKVYEVLGEEEGRARIKPINVTVDYMRGGRLFDTRAEGRVTRIGTRVANVTAEAWQGDRSKPIATAKLNLLIVRG